MNSTIRLSMACAASILLIAALLCAGCVAPEQQQAQASGGGTLKIATTTSLYDTGLLDAVEDFYENKTGVDLLITSQGTGKAIEIGKTGDVDILLVHSPSQEKAFMDAGYGVNQRCIAYNYFLIVGPESDPAKIKEMTPEAGFGKLITLGKNSTAGVAFASRGDNSGTHSAEKAIWKAAKLNYTADVQNSGTWYIEAGKGMGETLTLASEKGAYTLTDEGTFLAYKKQQDIKLVPIIDEGATLLNRYSIMAINSTLHPNVNSVEANRFINWIISDEGKQFIGDYGVETYGKSLFTPLTPAESNTTLFACDCSSPVTG